VHWLTTGHFVLCGYSYYFGMMFGICKISASKFMF